MTFQVYSPNGQHSDERLSYPRELIRAEATALERVAERLDTSFLRAVDCLEQLCSRGQGRLAITGTGKSADVGQKLAGTLNSTGTRAYLLDATRAVHGDLGMVHPEDVALVLSHSGESEEIVRLLPSLRDMVQAVIALTGNADSTLAQQANHALVYGPLEEVCPLGLAPSASTIVMAAIGDALAFTLSRDRGFTREDFARYHPAGSLGRKLLRVEAVMRQGEDLRLASADETVRQVFARACRPGRRTGALALVDDEGLLVGLFTDSDLARLIEARRDEALDQPVRAVMTPKPITVLLGTRLSEAMEVFQHRKISELPVVDTVGRPVGMLDITDVFGLMRTSTDDAQSQTSRPSPWKALA